MYLVMDEPNIYQQITISIQLERHGIMECNIFYSRMTSGSQPSLYISMIRPGYYFTLAAIDTFTYVAIEILGAIGKRPFIGRDNLPTGAGEGVLSASVYSYEERDCSFCRGVSVEKQYCSSPIFSSTSNIYVQHS